ncbi:MAG: hypothetical protein ACETVZ_00225 [Phycisphaerae bacterium]
MQSKGEAGQCMAHLCLAQQRRCRAVHGLMLRSTAKAGRGKTVLSIAKAEQCGAPLRLAGHSSVRQSKGLAAGFVTRPPGDLTNVNDLSVII